LEKQRILPIKSKKSKTKKYSVQKGPKLSKHNSTEDTGITQPTVFDPLAEKIDWDRPVENDIPHLLPYKRDDSNLKSVQEALVKKFTEEQKISEQNTKEVKKGRKMKGKGKPKKNSKKSSSDPKTKEKSKDKDKKKRTNYQKMVLRNKRTAKKLQKLMHPLYQNKISLVIYLEICHRLRQLRPLWRQKQQKSTRLNLMESRKLLKKK